MTILLLNIYMSVKCFLRFTQSFNIFSQSTHDPVGFVDREIQRPDTTARNSFTND